MDACPVDCGIRGTDVLWKRADEDTVARDQLIFAIGLIGDDAAAAGIDKHDWTIQAKAPGLSAVTVGSLLELPKILLGQFCVDSAGLCYQARNTCEQEQTTDHDPHMESSLLDLNDIVAYDLTSLHERFEIVVFCLALRDIPRAFISA